MRGASDKGMYNPVFEYNSKKLLEEAGLFFVGKKTVYLALHERGKRKKTVGFAGLVGKNDELCINVTIRNKDMKPEEWPDIQSIKMIMDNGCEIVGEIKKIPEQKKEIKETGLVINPDRSENVKWNQIVNQFKKVHPFGDEREYVALELKDLTLLSGEHQRLMNNSFLLHGFYNYRHIILGRTCGFASSGENAVYLGVPGVYYEREKQIAVMFGFQGFECAGQVEVGKFGYYMREVKI